MISCLHVLNLELNFGKPLRNVFPFVDILSKKNKKMKIIRSCSWKVFFSVEFRLKFDDNVQLSRTRPRGLISTFLMLLLIRT